VAAHTLADVILAAGEDCDMKAPKNAAGVCVLARVHPNHIPVNHIFN